MHVLQKYRAEKCHTTIAKGRWAAPMVFPRVTPMVCAQVVADWTGIPAGSLVRDEARMLLDLEDRLEKRIVGQSEAVRELANTIRASKGGMGNPDKPLGVFLFTGPSGVGKTECASAIAEIIFAGEKFSTVINMSEYQEKHTVSQLKGSPPGYVGYEEGGVLTEAVFQKPYSAVILDEIEKAHPEVMNMFYQVFDKGFMRDGSGREIDFKNSIIIMTSNMASEHITRLWQENENVGQSELVEAIRPLLCAHFHPALLARCKIIPFLPLSKDAVRQIVSDKLEKISQRIQTAHGITLKYSRSVEDFIVSKCKTHEAGARDADVVIDRVLLPGISGKILTRLCEGVENYNCLSIDMVSGDEIEITFDRAENCIL